MKVNIQALTTGNVSHQIRHFKTIRENKSNKLYQSSRKKSVDQEMVGTMFT